MAARTLRASSGPAKVHWCTAAAPPGSWTPSPAEVHNPLGRAGSWTVQDKLDLRRGRGVGVEEVAFNAGVGHLEQALPGRLERVDGVDDEVFVRAAFTAREPLPVGMGGTR